MSPFGLTFQAQAHTDNIQELARNAMKGGFEDGRLSGVGGREMRYKYRLSGPRSSEIFFFFSLRFLSLFSSHFVNHAPVEHMIFSSEIRWLGRCWFDNQD
jgi:hypothetical protein